MLARSNSADELRSLVQAADLILLQPVHPGCVCHPLMGQQGNGIHPSVGDRSCLPNYEEER